MVHYARSSDRGGEMQLLRDHLIQVGARAGDFAAECGLPREIGEWAGWLHDLGKYSDEFQRYRLGLLPDGTTTPVRGVVEHAAHGAWVAGSSGAIEVAFAVAAHHSGLSTTGEIRELSSRAERCVVDVGPLRERAKKFVKVAELDGVLSGKPAATVTRRGEELALELRTRLLLSCLADADRLDAEAWVSPERKRLRRTTAPLNPAACLAALDTELERIRARPTGATRVQAARTEVMAAARAAGRLDPGFFSLTAPTGTGKTLASLAFALEHARTHGLRRIIFVLPFLAVIEQNAIAIRKALGDPDDSLGLVLEHHSNVAVDETDDGQDPQAVRRRLLAENWDAPIIVTTTVQFFESLFAAHPTRVRKIHNIPNSVVVFDEAQTFPPGLLKPLMGMLRQLKDNYRCSFLFCTATQPAFDGEVGAGVSRERLLPEGALREIGPDPAGLFAGLERVVVDWPHDGATVTMNEVADAMAEAHQALAVVNTKAQARALFNALLAHDLGAIHLSTRLCSKHRQATLVEVRKRLKEGDRCLVAATQLVEAGVDIDFPAVWRAFGPLDAIAQAAGRCNREGRLPGLGRVTVFHPEDSRVPGGEYRRGCDVTREMLSAREIDLSSPAIYREYFERFYNTGSTDLRRIDAKRRALDFPAVAAAFRIIDEDTRAVLVPWGDGREWIIALERGNVPTPSELRRMQGFTVGLYTGELMLAKELGVVEEIEGVLVFRGEYDERLGLRLPGDYSQD